MTSIPTPQRTLIPFGCESAVSLKSCINVGLAALSLVLIVGCYSPASVGEACDAMVGDLVISEFLPNPRGSDYDREWFEIYNASSKPQVLDRLVVRRINFRASGVCAPDSDAPGEACYYDDDCLNSCRSSTCQDWCGGPFGLPEDGKREVTRHTLRGAGILAPHSYFVLADGPRTDINADYNYALRHHKNPNSSAYSSSDYRPSLATESLPDFGQKIGGLAIACKGETVDEVLYGTRDGVPAPRDGVSLSFSGKLAPDALVNDDPRYWCEGTVSAEDDIPGRCALDPEMSCQTSQDCESRQRCFFKAGKGAVDHISDVACAEELDCARLTEVGHCFNGDDLLDTTTPCMSKSECLPTMGTCSGENQGAECSSRCECGVSCDTSCKGYSAPRCVAQKVYDCAANSCKGHVAANLGTPGRANTLCPFVAVDSCMEEETERSLDFPDVGDLILTELFADPSSTADFPTNSDDNREWLELYVNSDTAVDLNGLEIRFHKTSDDGTVTTRAAKVIQGECLRGEARSYIVLGESMDKTVNGGVEVDGVLDSLNIYNNQELVVELVIHGSVVVDSAHLPKSTSGRSSSLTSGSPDPGSNDVAESFCKSESEGLFAQGGTPGSANSCSSPVGCMTPEGNRGVVAPGTGDLIITEVLFDPSGPDADKEWIEVYNASDRSVDLNGVSLANYSLSSPDNIRNYTVQEVACVSVEPGGFAVIGSTDDVFMNGNLPVDGSADGFTLYNSAGALELSHESVLIDRALYPDSRSGTSLSLKSQFMTAEGNDAPGAFCESQTAGHYDGFGTPGQPNVCGAPCNDVDGVRQVVSPEPGDLVVTEFMANPVGSDAGKEWVELYVSSSTAVDLNGILLVAGNASSSRERELLAGSDQCVTVQPGTWVVFGGEAVESVGVEVDATWGRSELFYNSSLHFEVKAPDGTVLDTVPGPFRATSSTPARSHVLSADAVGVSTNDNPENWCRSTDSDSGDYPFLGSPGQANQSCP